MVEGVSIASSLSCPGFESDLATLSQHASDRRSSATMKAGDERIKQHWNQSLITSPPRSSADTAESVIDKQFRSWSIKLRHSARAFLGPSSLASLKFKLQKG